MSLFDETSRKNLSYASPPRNRPYAESPPRTPPRHLQAAAVPPDVLRQRKQSARTYTTWLDDGLLILTSDRTRIRTWDTALLWELLLHLIGQNIRQNICYKSFRYNKENLDKEAQNWVIENSVT